MIWFESRESKSKLELFLDKVSAIEEPFNLFNEKGEPVGPVSEITPMGTKTRIAKGWRECPFASAEEFFEFKQDIERGRIRLERGSAELFALGRIFQNKLVNVANFRAKYEREIEAFHRGLLVNTEYPPLVPESIECYTIFFPPYTSFESAKILAKNRLKALGVKESDYILVTNFNEFGPTSRASIPNYPHIHIFVRGSKLPVDFAPLNS
jgi:hypothetical protein